MTIVASVDERRVLRFDDLGGFQMAAGCVEEAREALRVRSTANAQSDTTTRGSGRCYRSRRNGTSAPAISRLRTKDFTRPSRESDESTPPRRNTGSLGLGWAALGVDRRREKGAGRVW